VDWQEKAKIIHEVVAKRWEPYSPEDWRFLALALAGEAGELANLIKKEWRGDIPSESYRTEVGAEGPWRGAWLQAVTEEMVDIRIYLHLMALAFDVD
jgi:NTP pyrophosphatase (non-canonical NTP hydrolase)